MSDINWKAIDIKHQTNQAWYEGRREGLSDALSAIEHRLLSEDSPEQDEGLEKALEIVRVIYDKTVQGNHHQAAENHIEGKREVLESLRIFCEDSPGISEVHRAGRQMIKAEIDWRLQNLQEGYRGPPSRP